MIALQTIRNSTDQIRQSCRDRGVEAPIDLIIDLDIERNPILNKVEQMRAARNTAGKAIGTAETEKERQILIAEQRQVSGELDELEKKLNNLETQISTLLLDSNKQSACIFSNKFCLVKSDGGSFSNFSAITPTDFTLSTNCFTLCISYFC